MHALETVNNPRSELIFYFQLPIHLRYAVRDIFLSFAWDLPNSSLIGVFMINSTASARQLISSSADLGAAIRKRRSEAGLTLAVAALSCGVSTKFLQALETGKATVQFDKAIGVACHFGLALVIA